MSSEDQTLEEAEHLAWLAGLASEASDLAGAMPQNGVLCYDYVPPPPWRPYGIAPWTPFRNRLPSASKCYRLASGARVHVKPGCRCPR